MHEQPNIHMPIGIRTKVYWATLSQTGTNPPTANVLKNTIGDIVWTRTSAGNYSATLEGAFPANKVLLLGTNGYSITNVPLLVVANSNSITLQIRSQDNPIDDWIGFNIMIIVVT